MKDGNGRTLQYQYLSVGDEPIRDTMVIRQSDLDNYKQRRSRIRKLHYSVTVTSFIPKENEQ